MTIPKRNKKRKYTKKDKEFWGADKSMSAPPANKAILEPVKKKSRQCDYCLTFSDSIYCPRCGKVTNLNKGN